MSIIAGRPQAAILSSTARLTGNGDDEGDGGRREQDAYQDILKLLHNSLPKRLLLFRVELVWTVLGKQLLCHR